MKYAIIIQSDTRTGTIESLGRVFNALDATYDFKTKVQEVNILFQEAGTRWIGQLTKEDHPAHVIYKSAEGNISDAYCGCADVFRSREELEKSVFELIAKNVVPETSGLPSLAQLTVGTYGILIF